MGHEETKVVRTIILIASVALLALCLVTMGSLDVDGQETYEQRVGLFVRGDYDLSGNVCMADAVGLLWYLWGRDCYPLCEDSADSNDDGMVDLSDVIDILDIVFIDGTRWQSLTCGIDKSEDNLSCEYDSFSCDEPEGYQFGY